MNTRIETSLRPCRSFTRARRRALGASILLAACMDPDAPGSLVPRTVDEDPSLPSLEINGTKVHAEAFGASSSPVLIMLHGGPGNDYQSLLRLREPVDGVRLEDRHRVIFWDQRGSGLSRRHDAQDITGDTYDGDLLALADRFSPGRPVVLIGHSWGGMYLSDFISRHPERVAGAVLMDSGPLTGALFEEVQVGIQTLDVWSEGLNDTSWAQSVVTPDGHARLDYMLRLGSLGNSQRAYHLPDPPAPIGRLGAVANRALQRAGMPAGRPTWDFTRGLARFSRRVLFEGAELNEATGADFQRRQARFYPNAELVVIQGAGHEFPWTHPEATLRPIFAYLAAINF